MISTLEQPPIELLKYPYPYQAAFTVASDIDSASIDRFRAMHALLCGSDTILEGSADWQTLGLARTFSRFDSQKGGIPGLGLELADSFFLIADPTTFGMYRYVPQENGFEEDQQNGENCAALIRQWLRQRAIDSYHTFLHYRRVQVKGLLEQFFAWCDEEGVPKPSVWINHSTPSAPSGLCPQKLQPAQWNRLARLAIRPLFGRKRIPLKYAFARYYGDKPGTPYYINDVLSVNGLRYVWLNAGAYQSNQIYLPETSLNGRSTMLKPVTMEDGIRYYEFARCFGALPGQIDKTAYLRDSPQGFDASVLITESNLHELCRCEGTCILYTHWTHFRSMPLSETTLLRFELLKKWQDAGRIWITTTAKLLEWTRRRTFLQIQCRRSPGQVLVEIQEVDDPIFGRERLKLPQVHGLCFRTLPGDSKLDVRVALNGELLGPDQCHRSGQLHWLETNPKAATMRGDLFAAPSEKI